MLLSHPLTVRCHQPASHQDHVSKPRRLDKTLHFKRASCLIKAVTVAAEKLSPCEWMVYYGNTFIDVIITQQDLEFLCSGRITCYVAVTGILPIITLKNKIQTYLLHFWLAPHTLSISPVMGKKEVHNRKLTCIVLHIMYPLLMSSFCHRIYSASSS